MCSVAVFAQMSVELSRCRCTDCFCVSVEVWNSVGWCCWLVCCMCVHIALLCGSLHGYSLAHVDPDVGCVTGVLRRNVMTFTSKTYLQRKFLEKTRNNM